ncbi:MAG TPA: molybdate ABC transporter substrate-binding protein [Desulfobacteraceae bacterium]|nr:molybdate ABC transporter substrate-binding protein [Desulfobacteraceae bacterium]HPJ66608.1 molybdate ABC transporter substrate-binding protein [Desulfobacteraceae bacterium]HPQ27874.1 molybdate ABC transporter substrate-binding protein [Desulfobacteraceae bacterium]
MKRIILFGLSFSLLFLTSVSASELHFFAGAGLRQPVDRLIEEFQRKTGHSVVVDYDGSGRLLARIEASGQGDLFMPGSFFYIEKLQKKGKIHSWRPVVAHTPVIAVNKSKASEITRFEDLAKPGVRLALGDPKAMAFGKTAMKILERSGLKEDVLANVIVYGATVKQLALYVAQGDVDASIVGRTDAFQLRNRMDMIPIPDSYFEAETVAAAVLNTSSDLKAAAALRDYMSSSEAIKIFISFGFLPLKN